MVHVWTLSTLPLSKAYLVNHVHRVHLSKLNETLETFVVTWYQRAFNHLAITDLQTQCWTLCTAPEEEDVERHPDGIALLADPDGLQDARVSQLTTDQLVFKHACLLNAHQKKKKEIITCSKTGFVHAYDPQWRHNVRKSTFMLFGLMQRTKKGLHLQ